jgi:hypothetical protein
MRFFSAEDVDAALDFPPLRSAERCAADLPPRAAVTMKSSARAKRQRRDPKTREPGRRRRRAPSSTGQVVEPAGQRFAWPGGYGVLGLGDGLSRPLARFARRDAVHFVKQPAKGADVLEPGLIGDKSNPAIGEFGRGNFLIGPAQPHLADVFGDPPAGSNSR